jgi:hypothetical protein
MGMYKTMRPIMEDYEQRYGVKIRCVSDGSGTLLAAIKAATSPDSERNPDLYLAADDVDAARGAYGAALDFYASAQNERGQAYALWGLGRVAARTPGAGGAARGYLSRAREMFEALGLADEAAGAAGDLEAAGTAATPRTTL